MKKLSDYQGDEAIELWADLIDPIAVILANDNVQKIVQSGKPKLLIAKEILKTNKKEAVEILQRIDPEPVDGLNIVLRLVNIINDIGQNEEVKSFFGYAEQEQTVEESSGSPTENTKGAEK